MQKLILFKVYENIFAIDHKLVKKKYKKNELFSERADRAKRIKIKLDGRDIPLYDLPAMFNESVDETSKADCEAMLVKDEGGHMVLLANKIERDFEIEEDLIQDLSPAFGNRACRYFPKVFINKNLPVLVLNPSGIRTDKTKMDE